MKLRAILGLTLLSLMSGRSENWPQFRGAAGDGRSNEKNLPVTWSQTEGLRWKQAIPGEGHSSPVIWEKSIFLTSAMEDGSRMLLSINAADGSIAWQKKVLTAPRESMHRENSSASSTIATDGERLITSFQSGDKVDLRCFDLSGKELWAIQPLEFTGEHGYGYSPIIHNDMVIFDCRQEGEAATLALDKRSGNILWRATPGRKRISHVPPLVLTDGGRSQVIVSGNDETLGLDLKTGRELWRCDGPSDVAVAGFAYGEGMVFASAGYPAKTRMAIRVDGSGDVTNSKVVWKTGRQVSYVPSPVYHEGHFYSVVDEGLLFCFDAKTGEAKWDERLGGRFRSSLIYADGNIYAQNDKGKTTVFRASPEGFKKVAENNLEEASYATAAVANGVIYIRTAGQLYAIGK